MTSFAWGISFSKIAENLLSDGIEFRYAGGRFAGRFLGGAGIASQIESRTVPEKSSGTGLNATLLRERVGNKGGKREKRVGESRELNWYSRLSGNGRWFVRQSNFSGLGRRSFSRQLQGEKEEEQERATSCTPILRSSASFSRPLARPDLCPASSSASVGRADIWTRTKDGAREKRPR